MSEDYLAVTEAFGVKKAFFVGWSMGAAFAADVCAFPGPSALYGIIYFDGLPYCDADMIANVITPGLGTIIPGLMEANDVALFSSTIIRFVETCVYQRDKMPYRLRAAGLGDIIAQPPVIRQLCLARTQYLHPFLEAGKTLPLLMIHGEEDEHLVGKKIEAVLRPHFGDTMHVHFFQGVGHAPFLEEPDKVRDLVLSFVKRVTSAV